MGLLRALVLGQDLAPKVVAKARELGLLVNAVGDRVLRLAPPLTVSDEEIDRAADLLAEALEKA
jgi:acetylornithine/N-succinyldiaminopimelate aminotransferase